ncbi:type III secretion system export apparatus subunit SctV [Serratia quinivorans]|uniref:type III secretion system export apparatus subunit SctV n=1 Tax=Serratia quinivorans TaxID=137545 RepID=UPI002177B4B9|nr:type III secretion system export apparatus subunit SctV [Serratia quinivorans]CAI1009092.1 Secretion system apparatus protein SsaV [Serratia quinivorans]CAI1809632.1 Secretion system apparatus protein SsaV [Serratia quinivorans]
MKKMTHWLRWCAGRQDIVLAVMLIMAVFMIILPLPTLMVDLLIAINLTISLMLLMIAIYVREPLEFSAFPAVLLITTLFRLSLSISTTRLILLQHDAGDIVYTFGNFVVGGNLGIGLIIFTIITIVQFIVITKGSERVAEVGARFSLDGMPGKQMSIDGDMRAGVIDAQEARRLRSLVQKESQLYGAMDGAMKFVKGDAIASMIIILVNIFGGVAVGVWVHDMSASEALQTYAVLSVGDGLIAQIPALLISITAGIIVTRVPGQERQNLAGEIAQQMSHQPKPLFLAAGMLLLFALLPGFPSLIFLSLALLLGGGGVMLQRSRVRQQTLRREEPSLQPGSVPLLLYLPPELYSSDTLPQALLSLRWRLFEQMGLLVPLAELRCGEPGTVCRVALYQEEILSLPLATDDVLLSPPPAALVATPLFGSLSVWHGQRAALAGFEQQSQCLQGDERFIWCVEQTVLQHAKEFIGIQETRVLMDAMEENYGELVKELQRQLPLGKIAEVLQRLVEEGISIRDLRTIFEALMLWSMKEKDVLTLTEYVRIALRRHIIRHYCNDERWLPVWTVGNGLEDIIRESIRQTATGSWCALEPQQIARIIEQIRAALGESGRGLLITAIDVRRYLRNMLETERLDVHVLSYQEVGDDAPLQVLGNIELIGEQE